MEIPKTRQTSVTGTRQSSVGSNITSSGGGDERRSSRKLSTTSNNATQQSAAQAASSLALLLREDSLLTKFDMHVTVKGEEAPFSYAAALLSDEDTSRDHQQLAQDALGEVERKLTLVESLGERVSRTSPEAVAAPLLGLHGYTIEMVEDNNTKKEQQGNDDDTSDNNNKNNITTSGNSSSSSGNRVTLVAVRERCDRLKRQGEVLEGISTRVESSLNRGLSRVEKATKRLSRVLQLSATLKMILRLQFEASKLDGFYLDDLRDLTRAAASVAVIEDLLSKPEMKDGPKIDAVESVRPQINKTAAAVRKAAENLLQQYHQSNSSLASSSAAAVMQLGATLQVYYHLGELPQAAWSAVNHAIVSAEKVSNEFWSPTTLSNLTEVATTEAKLSVGSNKKMSDTNVQRAFKKKLQDLRTEAASKWASGIADISLQVWNLHQVLCRKSDPVSRQFFVEVVSNAPIPEKFQDLGIPEDSAFSIFKFYWERLCYKLGDRLKHILEYENGKFAPDVSALYPAIRAASVNMLASLNDTMSAGLGVTALEDTASSTSGVLGGSAALDDPFLQWTAMSKEQSPQTTVGGHAAITSADTWTVVKNKNGGGAQSSDRFKQAGTASTSTSAVFNSSEWISLQGNQVSGKGLFRLQRMFLEKSSERLCGPLKYMFPENVTVDENGNPISHLPLLPSRYDVQQFDTNIRQELALADPREGGGDVSFVTMIANIVIEMVIKFCDQAKNAASHVGEDGCLNPNDGSPTQALEHDMKVTKIMNAMAESLRMAPEKVFLAPYRPAVTSKLEEAASMCEQALEPGLAEIDKFVKTLILGPMCRAINRRVASALGRIHYSAYTQEGGAGLDEDAPSFVQKNLAELYDRIAAIHLSKLPPVYAAVVAANISTFSIYTFVSNIALMRPLSESARLHVTQDLADFELVLEQFMNKCGESKHISVIANGKPYGELRAMRQILFWTGLEDKSKPAASVAKGMLREVWLRDVRASTVFHYLFSFAPTLLSSPHHFKRMRVEEYIGTLVTLNGEVEDGEAAAWMTIMACCDTYQQRESAQHGQAEGDPRIASILMSLGPELLRRRRS